MYSVYVDNETDNNGIITHDKVLIHSSISPDKVIHLIDPTLKIGDSVAGSFEFTVPPYNPGYSVIQRMTSTIIVKKEGSTIWTGRVVNESMDFWNRRKLSAEGALAYLNDTIQELHFYGAITLNQFIQNILQSHNSRVPNNRKIEFNANTISVVDTDFGYEYVVEYEKTWEVIKKLCYDRLGGHLYVSYDSSDVPVLNYRSDSFIDTSEQTINFGENLLDFTRNWDLTNLVTVIYPRGKQLEEETATGQKAYVTIKSVNNNSPYLENTTAKERFGRIEAVVDFSDCETAYDLKQKATAYLTAMQFDEMVLEVSALDLHNLIGSTPAFRLLDEVPCISKPHGLNKKFPITEMDIPLDKPESIKYTMGTRSSSSLSNTVNVNRSDAAAAIKNLMTNNRTLELAKEQAATMLHERMTGYVNIVNRATNDGEIAEAIIISETQDYQQSGKYWIWNMQGLGFTNDGGQHVQAAMLMDGTIVANIIKTGILSDGANRNYWNLETGDFRLGSDVLIDDSYTIAELTSLANDAYEKKTGSSNYLNGSGDFANWRYGGGWSVDKQQGEAMCAAKNSVSNWNDVLKSSSGSIHYSNIKGYQMVFSFEGVSDDEWGTLSSTNCVVVAFSMVKSDGTRIAWIDKVFNFTTAWSRRYVAIDLLDSEFHKGSSYSDALASVADLEIWIYNRSKHKITIRRPQFERGNVPTDWAISEKDTEDMAQAKADEAYNDATAESNSALNDAVDVVTKQIEKNYSETTKWFNEMKTFNAQETQRFNNYLTQDKILRKMTNDYSQKLIYKQNNVLLINADYIRSGSLDADLLRTGIITDKQRRNYWNLDRGWFQSIGGQFDNANVTGTFRCGSGSQDMELSNGRLAGFDNGRLMGSIHYTGSYTDLGTGQTGRGLQITAKDGIRISSPTLAVSNSSNETPTAYYGVTNRLEYWVVESIEDTGNGSIRWNSSSHGFDVINGIITAIW